MRVSIWPHPKIRGAEQCVDEQWMTAEEPDSPAEPAELFPVASLPDAIRAEYRTDAHFAPYAIAGEDRAPRLKKAAFATLGDAVVFGAIVLDADDPVAHSKSAPASDEWRAAFWVAVDRLEAALGTPVCAYETRGGGRVVVGVDGLGADAFSLAREGLRAIALEVGLVCDRLVDLGRCYRLPYVRRAGEIQRRPLRGDVTPLPAPNVAGLVARGRAETPSEPAPRAPRERTHAGSERPGDQVNSLSWAEILEPRGWQFIGMQGNQEAWVRPGKDARKGDPASALTNYGGTGSLHVFSTSVVELEAGRSYDKFGAFAALEGVSDMTLAARLACERFGFERPEFERPVIPEAMDVGVKAFVQRLKKAVPEVSMSSVAPAPKRRDRAPVQITVGRLRESVAPAIEALAELPHLYQRFSALVELGRGPDGRMGMHPVTIGRLRLLCEDTCRFFTMAKGAGKTLDPSGRSDVDWVERDCKVDDRMVQAILASPGDWQGIRDLAGVVQVPVLHLDGSVCVSGYDPVTRLYADAPGFEEPGTTEDDARAALEELEGLLVDFPFPSGLDKAVVIAMWLTACVRQSMPVAPAFLIDSPSSGVGKTPLANIGAMISTGQLASMTKAPNLEDELQKTLFALCVAGEAIIAFDDVKTGSFGGDVFDQMITGGSVKGRMLGATQIVSAPAKALVMITGRNVTFRGDGAYRTMRARLVTDAERPDEQRHLWRHPDLLGYVEQHRTVLATACLTVLRAYLLAGRPMKMPPHKEFQHWNIVREALLWLGRPDVVDSVELQRDEADVDYSAYVTLCRAWYDAVGDTPMTLSGLFELLEATGTSGFVRPELASAHRKALSDAIVDMIEMGKGDARAPKVLSRRIRANIGRPAGGYVLKRAAKDKDKGAFHWQVTQTKPRGLFGVDLAAPKAPKSDDGWFQ